MIDKYTEAYEACNTYPEFREYIWEAQGGSISTAGMYAEASDKNPIIFIPRRNIFLKDFYVARHKQEIMLVVTYIMGLQDTDHVQDLSYSRHHCTLQWGGVVGTDPGYLKGQLTDKDKVNYRGG